MRIRLRLYWRYDVVWSEVKQKWQEVDITAIERILKASNN
jgi:hypothetical protein